jgi:hypothetical protein
MKRYTINYDWWEAVVDVDDTPETLEYMKEQILFWMVGEERLKKFNNHIIDAYIEMLSSQLIVLSMDYNEYGINQKFLNMEGWYPIDGTYGVKLISCFNWFFEEDNFDVSCEEC